MSDPPDQLDVALMVGAALATAGATWMIGGSIATSAYGEPRATHDVDLVADLQPQATGRFVDALGDAFYVDAGAVHQAARQRSSFNVIHFESIQKVDVFCLRDDPFARAGLEGRIESDLGRGRAAPIASPQHMVVEKLRWYCRGGEVSDRQLRDVQGVLQTSGSDLDLATLRHWADQVGVRDLLERMLAEAGL